MLNPIITWEGIMTPLSELQTPCGILKCTDQNGNAIHFYCNLLKSNYNTTVFDEILSEWVSVTPTFQSTITINSDSLVIGETYTLRLCGDFNYRFGYSDENAISNIITDNGISLSLGAYDPNDAEKDRQYVPVYDGSVRIGFKPPEKYNISKFQGYILSVLTDWSGFSFQLIDHTISKITFRLAWIQHIVEAESTDYENAIMNITTF